jgi:SAM-dependent methyltransferase
VPVTLGSFTDRASWPPGRWDQIWMVNNLIDVIDHERRGRLLDELRGALAPGGVLIFSSHNLDGVGHEQRLGWVRRMVWTPPMLQLRHLLRAGRRMRNRRRMGPLASRGDGHAILNDSLHDYALLLYFIGRDAQEAQLEAHGWRLLECLDGQGRRVERGEISRSQDLNYVAVPVGGAPAPPDAT